MKKVLSLLVAACIMIAVIPAFAAGMETEVVSGNYDYDYMTNLGGGLFSVGYACEHSWGIEDGLYGEEETVGVIAYDGELIVPVRFEWVQRISSQLIMAKAGNIHNALDIGPAALYDVNGKEIIYAEYGNLPSGEYSEYCYYDDKTILARTYAGTADGKWGVLDSDGGVILPFDYARIWNYVDYHFVVCVESETHYVIESEYNANPNDYLIKSYGEKVIDGKIYHLAYYFCELDRDGTILNKYESRSAVPDTVEWNYWDGTPKYDYCRTARIVESNGLYGYQLTDGTMLVPCIYLEVTEFLDDYAAVRDNEGWKIIHVSDDMGNTDDVEPEPVLPSEPAEQPTFYDIKKDFGANGSITVSDQSAREGQTVTLTVTPDAGHVLVSLTVMDGQGNAVAVQANPNGTYSFTMPASQVSVSAAFAPEEQDWVSPYSDIAKGEWYYDAVQYVTEQGLMNGVSAGSFAPTGTVTRGTLMTILARLNGVDTSAGEPWYQAGMTWAVANGVSDGTDPEGLITREQIAVMLYRAAGAPAVAGDFLGGFHDRDSVSPWAADAMNWAVSTGVIGGGDAGLAPQGAATRAELAAMLSRFAGL